MYHVSLALLLFLIFPPFCRSCLPLRFLLFWKHHKWPYFRPAHIHHSYPNLIPRPTFGLVYLLFSCLPLQYTSLSRPSYLEYLSSILFPRPLSLPYALAFPSVLNEPWTGVTMNINHQITYSPGTRR